jgi:4-hydroxyphenylpyruvate dioxygenase
MATNYVNAESVEYLEYAVKDLNKSSQMYESLNFKCLGRRNEESKRSKLYGQGDIRLVLSASSRDDDPVARFVASHGDGVIDVALRVPAAAQDIHIAEKRGAKVVATAHQWTGASCKAHVARVAAFGDVVHSFVTFEKGGHLEDFFPEDRQSLNGGSNDVSNPKGFFQTIDHITVNVEKGRMDPVAQFYRDVFGFTEVRHFDIRTEKSGLLSRALRSPNGRVTMPINEPTNEKSQIQEFLNQFNGPGVQHIAFHVSDIVASLKDLKTKGFEFLSVPDTYYEAIPSRVPNVREDLSELQKLNVLVDGSEKGYLLQIFSQTLVGPLFYELIQRRGDNGFGEGNFRALFEAIERDQMRRGVI